MGQALAYVKLLPEGWLILSFFLIGYVETSYASS
jgi:hypothetical protein